MHALARYASLATLLIGVHSWDMASAAIVTTQCGSFVSKTVLTSNGPPANAPRFTFSTIPGAHTVVNVPAGGSRCITVRFSAEATTNDAYGFVRATVGGASLYPQNNSLALLSTSGATERATHQFTWVRRVSPGSHNVNMQWALYTGGATFTIYTWTMEVEVAK